ncbi:LamG domain-containing protein [Moorena producens JHB]|uniref:LamG domain-containing protein n=1 Tax=Moorena producens (strain JHB) TaxID=1454205 RepID=A0A1D9G4R2_MOOP1|nr:LamG-like jellyroll fold domain-containing protein [Moorena producens]AOY82541.1 LamG domain-containing protein [Moorena producens JHB]
MPLPLPNLDDRTYADLLEEARSLIPKEYPDWTDHNPTDPGIILIEMLAWLTEMVIYRTNQIPDQNQKMFLKLLNGPEWQLEGDLQAALQQTIVDLRQRYRAVSSEDFEQLVLQDWLETPTAKAFGPFGVITRAKCVSQRNLALTEPTAREEPAPGHISLLVVPQTLADNYSLLSFDGQDDYLEIPHSDQLNFANDQDFTIEVWVRVNKVQARTQETHNFILEKGSGSGGFPYGIRYENQSGKLQVIRSDGTNFATISSTKAINDDNFHHVAFVKDSSTLYLYLDGALEGFTEDTNSDNTINNSSLYLGRRGNQSYYFQGTISQLRIWEGVRLEAEIKQEMNEYLQGTEKGLVGYWNLDEGSGTIANDKTPNQNHGTIQGASWYQPNINASLLRGLWSFLDERRLLTVRHHVVTPDYLPLRVWARLYLVAGSNAQQVQDQANQEAQAFFHPVNSQSYWDGQGWPFGRSIYVSELYQLLDRIPGVDYVEDIMIHTHDLTTTILTQPSSRPQTQITVKDTTGFAVGDTIQIDPSNSDQEYYTISSIEPGLKQLTLSSALNEAYGVGTMVVGCLSSQVNTSISNQEFSVDQITELAPGDTVRIIPTNSNPENREIESVNYSSKRITLKEPLSQTPAIGTKVVQLATWREERSKPKEIGLFIQKELIRVKLRDYELVNFNVEMNLVIMEYIAEQWQLTS